MGRARDRRRVPGQEVKAFSALLLVVIVGLAHAAGQAPDGPPSPLPRPAPPSPPLTAITSQVIDALRNFALLMYSGDYKGRNTDSRCTTGNVASAGNGVSADTCGGRRGRRDTAALVGVLYVTGNNKPHGTQRRTGQRCATGASAPRSPRIGQRLEPWFSVLAICFMAKNARRAYDRSRTADGQDGVGPDRRNSRVATP